MAKPLRRVSPAAEQSVLAIATREDRSFIAQLDRVVAAGLNALNESVPDELRDHVPTPPKRRTRATAAK